MDTMNVIALAWSTPKSPPNIMLLIQPCTVRSGWLAINATHSTPREVAYEYRREALIDTLIERYGELAGFPDFEGQTRCIVCGRRINSKRRAYCHLCGCAQSAKGTEGIKSERCFNMAKYRFTDLIGYKGDLHCSDHAIHNGEVNSEQYQLLA